MALRFFTPVLLTACGEVDPPELRQAQASNRQLTRSLHACLNRHDWQFLFRLSHHFPAATTMLTGDNQQVADAIAAEVGLTDAMGELEYLISPLCLTLEGILRLLSLIKLGLKSQQNIFRKQRVLKEPVRS